MAPQIKSFCGAFFKKRPLMPAGIGVSFVSFSLRLFLQRKAANAYCEQNGYMLKKLLIVSKSMKMENKHDKH